MDLIARLEEDIKNAMRQGDTLTRDTLRMLKSDLTHPDAPDAATVLARAVKSRRESAAQYEEGGRPDLAEAERLEIAVIERYLPKQLTEEQARDAVRRVATDIGATEKRDMGRLMTELMARHKGEIDGRLASRLAGEVLAG